MAQEQTTQLTSSELMVVLLAAIGFTGVCFATTMQFILRSRCTRIKLPCGCECDRDVVSSEQATTLDTSSLTSGPAAQGSLH